MKRLTVSVFSLIFAFLILAMPLVGSAAEINIFSTSASPTIGDWVEKEEKTVAVTNETTAGKNRNFTIRYRRYDVSNGSPYTYTYTNDSGETATIGKLYCWEMTNTALGMTAKWVVNNQSSFSSKTADEGTGQLTITMSKSINFGWHEKNEGENQQTYAPWQNIISRITSVTLKTDDDTDVNLGTIGDNFFRDLIYCKTIILQNPENQHSNENKRTGITKICYSAFRRCLALSNLQLRNNTIETIGDYAFAACENLKTIYKKGSTATDGIASIPEGIVSSSYSNIYTLPNSVTSIGAYAFKDCSSLQAVTFWEDTASSGSSKLITIGEYAFRNCTDLHYFSIPNSLETIGNYAFSVGSDKSCSVKVLKISEKSSNLKTIGDCAFINATDDNKGVRFYSVSTDDTTGDTKGTITANKTLIFPNLTYIGNRAFYNNGNLTGKFVLKQYCTIKGRAFVDTKLTNLYCRYDGTVKQNQATLSISSSTIGTSLSYVSSSKNYGNTNDMVLTIDKVKYYSLAYILGDNIEAWKNTYLKLGQKGYSYEDYKPSFDLTSNELFTNNEVIYDTSTSADSNYPELTYGTNNGVDSTNQITKNKTSTYLKTETFWETGKTGEQAIENVLLSYKNDTYLDVVFVVDTSPSMEEAVKDDGTVYKNTRNTSRLLTAFSQIYDISEKLLDAGSSSTGKNESKNTVSIVSFNGDKKNTYEGSSKIMIKGSNSLDNVYKTLFTTDENDEECKKYSEGGVTNWSAGLYQAYNLINYLRTENTKNKISKKQIVIFLTDGSPTYYSKKDDSVVTCTPTDNSSNGAIQVNGYQWARAIKSSSSKTYTVRGAKSSYIIDTDGEETINKDTKTVVGLDTPIYGILIGNSNYKSAKAQNVYKITHFENTAENDITKLTDRNERTFLLKDDDNNALSTAINKIFANAQSETMVAVIPFDDNFTVNTTATATISLVELEEDEVSSGSSGGITVDLVPHYTETPIDGTTYEFKLTANTWVCNTDDFSTYGRIKYDEKYNRLIWDLSNYTDYGLTSSAPYVTYKLTVTLDYNGSGYSTYSETAGSNYVEVSGNNTSSSKNYINTPYEKFGANYQYQYAPYGTYIYNATVETPTSTTDDDGNVVYTLAEPKEVSSSCRAISKALYLPLEYGEITINKVSTNTGEALEGAKYEIYDSNFNLMTFYRISTDDGYMYSTVKTATRFNGETSTAVTEIEGTDPTIVYDMRIGTYYVYEKEAPQHKNSALYYETPNLADYENAEKIECADGVERVLWKVSVDSIPTTGQNEVTIYNTLTSQTARLEIYPLGSDYNSEDFYYEIVGADEQGNKVTFNADNHFDDGDLVLFDYIAVELPIANVDTGKNYSYTVKQTDTPHDYYLTPEVSLIDFYQKGESEVDDITVGVERCIGELEANSTTDIYFYNPSVKLFIYNFDGDDKTTPINSTITLSLGDKEDTYTTDSNGCIDLWNTKNSAFGWFGLTEGITLEQTKVDNQYNLLAETVTFNIDENNIEVAYDKYGYKYYECKQTIYNSKKADIPYTGCTGTSIFYAFGIFCLELAIIFTFRQCRLKFNRQNSKRK